MTYMASLGSLAITVSGAPRVRECEETRYKRLTTSICTFFTPIRHHNYFEKIRELVGLCFAVRSPLTGLVSQLFVSLLLHLVTSAYLQSETIVLVDSLTQDNYCFNGRDDASKAVAAQETQTVAPTTSTTSTTPTLPTIPTTRTSFSIK